jgi:outer membrane lipoprotein LolB
MKSVALSVFFYRLQGARLTRDLITTALCLIGFCHPLTLSVQEKMYPVQAMPLGLHRVNWSSRRAQLQQMGAFSARGYLAIGGHQYKGITLPFHWKQSLGTYQLILGESGQEVVEVTSSKGKVTLRLQDKCYSENSAESLLQKYLGVSLPLNYLADWLKGIPQRNKPHERVLNPTQHLLTLSQGRWFIRYLRYHQIKGVDLPTQLCMMQNNWYVRIFITHWAPRVDR